MVGIFVNQPLTEVAALARRCGLDYLQLSGEEDAGYCRRLATDTGAPIVKAVRLGRPDEAARVEAYIAGGNVAVLLADSAVTGSWGGSGEAWEWSAAAGLARRFPLLLAGGLTAQNVRRAVDAVRPWGVDVASGVETNGETDPARVRAFVEQAKQRHLARS
jgi:phosphoribosylanthranilate isomerase